MTAYFPEGPTHPDAVHSTLGSANDNELKPIMRGCGSEEEGGAGVANAPGAGHSWLRQKLMRPTMPTTRRESSAVWIRTKVVLGTTTPFTTEFALSGTKAVA
jgi:hypothetical protein